MGSFSSSQSSASAKATSGSSSNNQQENLELRQRCTLHTAGHGIVPALGINALQLTWQEARIRAVRGTRVQLTVDGQNRYFWNHDSARLFEFWNATDSHEPISSEKTEDVQDCLLLWNEEHQLLGLRDGKVFSLAHLSAEPPTACSTAKNQWMRDVA